MALSFHTTTAPLFGFGHRLLPAPDAAEDDDDVVHSAEVTDALLGFLHDPLDASNTALDDLLTLPPPPIDAFLSPLDDGATTGVPPALAGALTNDEYVLQLPLPLPAAPVPVPVPRQQVPEPLGVFVRGEDANKAAGGACQSSVQISAARQSRKRISDKTAELARLIPGGRAHKHKLSTAEMLEAAARHVKLLQAQVGVLALMRAAAGTTEMQEEKMPMPSAMAPAERIMHALLACGSVQERLAAEGKCLVPRTLVDAVAEDDAVTANPVLRRDLARFVASLQAGQ